MLDQKARRRQKIRHRVRKKVRGTKERPRLSIFKSNKSIQAQIIDDQAGHTLTQASSTELNLKNNNIEVAKQVGQKLAEKAKAAGIKKVVFDRSGYIYHGKIRALAEGAREGGIKF